MYKLLIVDDEHLIRESLKRTIPWKEMDIEVAGVAKNGVEALKLAEEIKPDMVLSDIRMPVMDGLELARKLKESHIGIRVIFISSYDDFSYAQQAVKIGVDDYVLKPIDNEKVKECICNTVSIIEKERNREDDFKRLESDLRESLLVYKTKLLRDIVNGVSLNRLIRQNPSFLGFEDRGGEFCVICFKIDRFKQFESLNSEHDRQLYRFSIANIAGEILGQTANAVAFDCGEDEVCTILEKRGQDSNGSYAGEDIEIKRGAEDVLKNVKDIFGFTITAGISRWDIGIESVPDCYSEALRCAAARLYSGTNSVIHIRGIAEISGYNTPKGMDFHKRLINSVSTGNSRDINLITGEFFAGLKSASVLHREGLQRKCIELLVKVSNFFSEEQSWRDDLAIKEDEVCSKLLESETMDEMKSLLTAFFDNIIEIIASAKTDKNFAVVLKAKEYISQNLHRDISMEEVSEAVELSPNYFSNIFKKKTGMRPGEYILGEKMEKARSCLLNTNLKVYEISEKMGFNDPKYFCTVFKKYFKMAPSEIKNG